jgi:hypothetical protein
MEDDNKFYRFRSFEDWNVERFLSEMEDIEEGKLTFVNPANFNDPFEYHGEMMKDLNGVLEHFAYLISFLMDNAERYNIEEFPKNFKEIFTTITKENFAEDIKSIDIKKFSSQSIKNILWKIEEKYIPAVIQPKINKLVELERLYIKVKSGNLPRENLEITIQELKNLGMELESKDINDELLESKTENLIRMRENIYLYIANYRHFLAKSFITCFAKRSKLFGQYYWVHYGEAHYGYALEYKLAPWYCLGDEPQKVHYRDFENLPETLAKFDTKTQAPPIFPSVIKSKDWEVEEEWRMFYESFWMDSNDYIKRNLKESEKLTGVYLGLRFKTESARGKHLLAICKKRNIPVYKMEMQNNLTLKPAIFNY